MNASLGYGQLPRPMYEGRMAPRLYRRARELQRKGLTLREIAGMLGMPRIDVEKALYWELCQ